MTVTVLCPNLTCRSVLQVPDRTRGKKVRCGKCGLCFLVPIKHPVPIAPGLRGEPDGPSSDKP